MTNSFTPEIYLKQGCPFCFKLRLFLLEAGMIDIVHIAEYAPGTAAEKQKKEELSHHFDSGTFPVAQTAPGAYLKDSDAIIAYFGAQSGVNPEDMPTLKAYIAGPFASLIQLYKENMELKSKSV
ncbi:glutathione S-transferase N-terminal domain-containing protein [Sphingobium sp.]|uniref:glutathione S-transferase N-terminal domain-containing protein n=1 Tax=Sphingobium sp. TaxID=1912891 RepID=UPI0028BDE1F6|nr:glutathione S-transferase N-terminal domain-containing protein [Sphingobium sp.]